MKKRISENFQLQLNNLCNGKTAKSSLAKGHMGGGGGVEWGYPDWGPATHWLGGPYTRKTFFKTKVQMRTQRRRYAKKFWVPRLQGDTQVKIQKIVEGSFLV